MTSNITRHLNYRDEDFGRGAELRRASTVVNYTQAELSRLTLIETLMIREAIRLSGQRKSEGRQRQADCYSEKRAQVDEDKRQAKRQHILKFMRRANKPVTMQEIATAIKATTSTARTYCKWLRKNGMVVCDDQVSGAYFWSIAESEK